MHSFNDLENRWNRVRDHVVKRLDPAISVFENKLRGSEEVTSLLLSQNDWYGRDRNSGRVASFVSCICLLVLNVVAIPFKGYAPHNIFGRFLVTSVIPRTQIKQAVEWAEITSARIKKPPGSLLLGITDFFFSKKTVALTFKPLIADWQAEYFEALEEKRYCKARWVSVRYYWAFAKACGLSKFVGFFKTLGLK